VTQQATAAGNGGATPYTAGLPGVAKFQGTKVRQLLWEFFKERPLRGVIVLTSLALSGLADGLGMISIFPLLGFILGDSGSAPTAVEELVSGAMAYIHVSPSTTALLIIIILAMVAKGGLVLLAMLQIGYAVTEVSTEYRLALIRALMKARWSFFLGHPISSFSNALGMESHVAASVFLAVAQLIAGAIQIAIYVAIAAIASWQASVAALAAGAVIVILLRGFVKMGRRAGRARARSLEILQHRLGDALQGIKPLKAMALEDRFAPMLEKETYELNSALRLEVMSKQAMAAAQEPLVVAFVAIGIMLASATAAFPPGILIGLGLIFVRTTGRIADLQRRYRNLRGNESFREAIKFKIDEATAAAEKEGGEAAPQLSRSIVVDNLSFSYGEHAVFDRLYLEIAAGSVTTVLGSSGLGKSTLLDLITGLYEPDAGCILIDGVALSTIDKASWRRQIGYLPQEMFLFHDTIRANVTIGDPAFLEEDVVAALTDAGAMDFVSRANEGLDTVVGERGGKLSGGQRQRIGIARALVRKPRLLILDEPTTALDPKSEAELCDTLGSLDRRGMTVLAISHQPAVADIADHVIDLGAASHRPMDQQPSAVVR